MKVVNIVPDNPFSTPSNFEYPNSIKDYLISSYTIAIKNPTNDHDKSIIGRVYIFNKLKWLNNEYLDKKITKDDYISQYNKILSLQKTDKSHNNFVNIMVEFISSDNKKLFTTIDISSDIGDYSVDYPPIFNQIPTDELVLANVFGSLPKYWKSVYGIDGTIWDLKINIDNPPITSPDVTPIGATPSISSATSSTSTKINLTIVDLGDNPTVQAKTDIDDFIIYIGDEPKPQPDVFEDLPELDSEYIEVPYNGLPDDEIIVNLDQEFASFPDTQEKFNKNDNLTLPYIEKSTTTLSDSSKKETMSNKQITVIREKTSSNGVAGTMYFNGVVIALTLERPFNPPQNENPNLKCITAGKYNLGFMKSDKKFLIKHYVYFTDSVDANLRTGVVSGLADPNPPKEYGVPYQKGIRIHGGGPMTNSLGCILVSNKRKSNGYDLGYDINVAKSITKLIYSKNITKILIINEFDKNS
jgi:hypothetical protein